MKVDQFYREFLQEYENLNRGENIMKSKLLPFIAIGAVVGAAISMLDKKTRDHTVDTAKKAKETVTYYAENRDELGAGTTYGALKSLQDKKYIETLAGEGRKKEYVITELGKEIVEMEVQRLKELYENGQTILLQYRKG